MNGNALKSHSLNVCYQSRGNMKELIGKVKTGRKPHEKSGIYRIKCKNCLKWYYGGRRKVDREKEHNRAIRNKEPKKSAVAAKGGHQMLGTGRLGVPLHPKL